MFVSGRRRQCGCHPRILPLAGSSGLCNEQLDVRVVGHPCGQGCRSFVSSTTESVGASVLEGSVISTGHFFHIPKNHSQDTPRDIDRVNSTSKLSSAARQSECLAYFSMD